MAPLITAQHLQTLRLKYNVAWGVHEECMRAITTVRLRGEQPTAVLVDREARAKQALEYAREQLRIGMTESIAGHHPIQSEPSDRPALALETSQRLASDIPES